MVLGIVTKFRFSKICFSEANICSNFKGIRFNLICLIQNSYKLTSICFKDFNSFQICLQFAFNSLPIRFTFVSHSLHICFKFASN